METTMKPIKFENQAAQGDMLITRIDEIPADAQLVPGVDGALILAHSETGHNHVVMERSGAKLYQDAQDPMTAYLHVLSIDTVIEHQRSFDTHKPLSPKTPGKFRVRRQREHTAEGWRPAQD